MEQRDAGRRRPTVTVTVATATGGQQCVDGLCRRACRPAFVARLRFADKGVALPVVRDFVATLAQCADQRLDYAWRGVAVNRAGQIVARGRPTTQAGNGKLAGIGDARLAVGISGGTLGTVLGAVGRWGHVSASGNSSICSQPCAPGATR